MTVLVIALIYIASLAMVAYTLFVELPRSAVVQARINLLLLQRELSAMRASATLQVSGRAYIVRRRLLGCLIRHANDVTAARYCFTRLSRTNARIRNEKNLREALANSVRHLPRATVHELTSIEQRAYAEILLLMVRRSILATVLLWPVRLFATTARRNPGAASQA
ncbi:hypothetical protein KPL74_21525 [Bacillus sp. NP157]|nr:hypothetical protein KPL74_21525 [Bacillus sp. NP157]